MNDPHDLRKSDLEDRMIAAAEEEAMNIYEQKSKVRSIAVPEGKEMHSVEFEVEFVHATPIKLVIEFNPPLEVPGQKITIKVE